MSELSLTPDNITKYLDECITYWRGKRKQADDTSSEQMAICYVDAYQSVRVTLFGELLPQ